MMEERDVRCAMLTPEVEHCLHLHFLPRNKPAYIRDRSRIAGFAAFNQL